MITAKIILTIIVFVLLFLWIRSLMKRFRKLKKQKIQEPVLGNKEKKEQLKPTDKGYDPLLSYLTDAEIVTSEENAITKKLFDELRKTILDIQFLTEGHRKYDIEQQVVINKNASSKGHFGKIIDYKWCYNDMDNGRGHYWGYKIMYKNPTPSNFIETIQTKIEYIPEWLVTPTIINGFKVIID